MHQNGTLQQDYKICGQVSSKIEYKIVHFIVCCNLNIKTNWKQQTVKVTSTDTK